MRHLRAPEPKPMLTSQQTKRARKLGKRARWIIVAVLVAAITVVSVVTVAANTADVVVYDDGTTYAFSVLGMNPNSILARAETEGMPRLSDIDTYDFNALTGEMQINRAVRVSVTDLGETQVYIAPRHTGLDEVLSGNGYTFKEDDVVEPALSTELVNDANVSVVRFNRVTVDADGSRSRIELLGGTVETALNEVGVTLGEKDTVEPAADTQLTDGMRIYVGRYVSMAVEADGEVQKFTGAVHSYAAALEALGIELGDEDRIAMETADGTALVDPEDAVINGASLHVQRVSSEEYIAIEDIKYKTEYEYTDDLFKGEESTKVKGENGSKRVLYRITYVDGEIESEVPVEEEVLEEATNAFVQIGTRKKSNTAVNSAGGTFVDSAGKTVKYIKSMSGSGTAYTAPSGKNTATGLKARVGLVAVNPNIIPYGSKLYITSPDGSWTYGYCQAADTGGAAMNGDIIADLFYNTEAECYSFGRRDILVYIISEGWD